MFKIFSIYLLELVSIEVANWFIGYNRWCSNIVSLERLELAKREGGKFLARFKCTIRHTLRDDGRSIEGTGRYK